MKIATGIYSLPEYSGRSPFGNAAPISRESGEPTLPTDGREAIIAVLRDAECPMKLADIAIRCSHLKKRSKYFCNTCWDLAVNEKVLVKLGDGVYSIPGYETNLMKAFI